LTGVWHLISDWLKFAVKNPCILIEATLSFWLPRREFILYQFSPIFRCKPAQNIHTKKFWPKSCKFVKLIRFKICATHNILISLKFSSVQKLSRIYCHHVGPWLPEKRTKTAVWKVLFYCLNFKLSELNRLIVLHKSAQNKWYFNIVAII
jgi:hypothetical protein